MSDEAARPAFLFMFSSGSTVRRNMVVEAVAAEMTNEENRSAAARACERHWFGSERELGVLLGTLGFSILDQQDIMASLHSHRDIALKLEIDWAQVEKAGFA